jgi:proteasome lid subunit RPN8/RPN11
MTRLVLGADLRAQLEREAQAVYPLECCGLIEGTRDKDLIRALLVHSTRNLASQPDRFSIDPAEHIRLLRGARDAGRQIVGCYHSHPNGTTEPSVRDREGAGEKGFVWLIVALANRTAPKLAAFVDCGERFEPIALVEQTN